MSPSDVLSGVSADLSANVLVMAKAPVPGFVKTRLGRDVGMAAAADLAAAALLDTMDACEEYAPNGCYLALDGSLIDATRGDALAARLRTWTVFVQQGDSFAQRLVHAHASVPGPVIQVGMDTPQATAQDLAAVVDGFRSCDAVLAPAEDGGWWALALRDPHAAACLRDVPMSTPNTGRDTRAALCGANLRVGSSRALRDIDTVADAHIVAETTTGAFSQAWFHHRQAVSQ